MSIRNDILSVSGLAQVSLDSGPLNFHFHDSPGHLDHHVEGVVAGGQGDVVEGGDGALTVLDEHPVGVGVGLPPLLSGVV